jgi:hypothetical protein
METYVFGDSHAVCFTNIYLNKVHSYRASSAKGLNNKDSISGVNNQIAEIITSLPENSNIIMFFGKVDLDFIMNYKYNSITQFDYNEYIISIANSYVEFIKSVSLNKNVYICELPITHIDDKHMLDIIRIEGHSRYINWHLTTDEMCSYFNFDKVIPYDIRVNLYILFNDTLKKICKLNNYVFIEINKYFINEYGQFEIPSKYINTNDMLDHHLLPNISELYIQSMGDI